VKKSFVAALSCLCLSGCLGYHVGPIKPTALRDIHTISVSTFTNRTLHPRIEVLVTDTIIKQLQQDGTFQIVGQDKADAILRGEINDITRAPARSVRGSVLATTEFTLAMHVKYKLVGRDGRPLVDGGAAGTTSFFVGSDVTTDERQALPLATEQLATQLASQLSEGW
jgi:hypothetical protein